MRKLSGPEWFEKYRGSRERYAALEDLKSATRITIKTLYRACINAQPVTGKTARRLSDFAGAVLDAGSLTMPDPSKALPLREQKPRRPNSQLDGAAA